MKRSPLNLIRPAYCDNRHRLFALTIGAMAALLSCTNPPTTAVPLPQDNKVAASTPQPAKPAHDCVTTELSQMYVEDSVRLAGESDTYLHYCFVSGYQGIGCGDNWEITQALGHSLSNRERAKCDAIMGRREHREAAEEARKKQLDEAYDKKHGLKPAN